MAKKVLLYSGGSDSWLIDKLWKPDLKVYVDMHTRYSEQEIKRIKEQGDDVLIVDFPLGQWERPDAIIPLRNLYLVMVICNITGSEDVEICLGATAGDRVLDKSPAFVEKANDLLNYLYQPQHWIPEGKHVKLNIDFKDKTKTEMLKMFAEQGGDLNEAFTRSFSCYDPVNGEECWQCKPCFRKFVAFDRAGYQFDPRVAKTVVNYINREILPSILDGTYGRGEREEQDIKDVVYKYKDLIE